MKSHHDPRQTWPVSSAAHRGRARRGATLVIVAVAFTLLAGLVGMAIDFSRMGLFSAELQTVADAAALSAAIDQHRGRTEAQTETRTYRYRTANRVEGQSLARMDASDIVGVTWNFQNRTQSNASSWAEANGVKVTAHYTAAWTLGRIFGSSKRELSKSTIAAYGGSITASPCLKPWAIPYAAVLSRLGLPIVLSHSLTVSDVAMLRQPTAVVRLSTTTTPDPSSPSSFSWVDVNVRSQGSSGQDVSDAMLSCVSRGVAVGKSLAGVPGSGQSPVVFGGLQQLCAGALSNGQTATYTCSTSLPVVLVPIYDAGSANGGITTFRVRYIGAFKLTAIEPNAISGYLTSITAPPSGAISDDPGPAIPLRIVQ